jgi:4-hydroxybenzoate polyprenyltransferase
MNLRVALRLGRVSNLPTVWTNVLTGVVLAGVGFKVLDLLILMLAGSLFYVGGMYLNDAFDAEIDQRERPERPIPSGQVTARTVFVLGFAMLLGGIGLLTRIGLVLQDGASWPTIGAGLILALTVLVYDGYHKNNPLSPVLMGICRILLYVMAALALRPAFTLDLAWACVVLLSYLIGLTQVAKQENLGRVSNAWPLVFLAAPLIYGLTDSAQPPVLLGLIVLTAWTGYSLSHLFVPSRRHIPRAVAGLIAGISLVDALLIGMHGGGVPMFVAFAGFGATLLLHRYVPGT